MDLESELRKAMAEQVATATAPPSLVADVRRRHRRRVTRIRVGMGVAAASVAAVAFVPTYHSFTATPAGAPESGRPSTGVSVLQRPEEPPAPGAPAPSPAKGKPGAGPTHGSPGAHPSGGGSEGRPAKPGPPPVRGLPDWVTFLPDGLTPSEPCASTGEDGRRTTTCAWHGPSGWVEVAIVRGTGFGIGDLAPVRGVPGHTSVDGTPALTSDVPGSGRAGRQVSWLARPGVGVIVRAGGSAEGQLMRIAEGVRP
ncbi:MULTISPECIES: hypothetical protein [Actinomadura]|uniref:Uncharacterized protein n=1 Tax=Actinomadura litoris TaxID=2678616 RepID=A0A7K1L897_9ACTN|nr:MULTISPECIES: hypothetical protein [Actinomadura]MBT2210349.1 hypothetical protein [Actinomadura sp. NEAU-AAG7]MUN40660.1 hypothetical protein [Actinomadura litoris]